MARKWKWLLGFILYQESVFHFLDFIPWYIYLFISLYCPFFIQEYTMKLNIYLLVFFTGLMSLILLSFYLFLLIFIVHFCIYRFVHLIYFELDSTRLLPFHAPFDRFWLNIRHLYRLGPTSNFAQILQGYQVRGQ